MFQTEPQQAETGRWAVLATHLNGAVDSGKYQHITTEVILRQLQEGDILAFLARELGADVDLTQFTDVERHQLLQHWRTYAVGYEPYQFQIRHNGLALLVGYLLHLIQVRHTKIPK